MPKKIRASNFGDGSIFEPIHHKFFILWHTIQLFVVVIIPAFFFRKKGYINFVPKLVRRPSVRASVRPCGCASVTFLVNVSPPKRLDVATSNFVAE